MPKIRFYALSGQIIERDIEIPAIHLTPEFAAFLARSNPESLLQEALKSGYTFLFEPLLNARADLNYQNANNGTILSIAAGRNSPDTINLLTNLDAVNPNLATCDGLTPLQIATLRGDKYVIRALVSAGAHVDAGGPRDESPLCMAAATGQVSSIRALISEGAGVNTRGRRLGETALHVAAKHGHVAAVRELLKARADPNMLFNDQSALSYAIERNHDDVTRELIKAGADVVCPHSVAPASSALRTKLLIKLHSCTGEALYNDISTNKQRVRPTQPWLDLSFVRVTPDKAAQIAMYLNANPHIKQLKFVGTNRLTTSCVKDLLACIANCPHILELNLKHCALTHQATIDEIGRSMLTEPTLSNLRRLDLSYSQIDDAGARLLAYYLEHNTTLIGLKLHGCPDISPETHAAIRVILIRNQKLTFKSNADIPLPIDYWRRPAPARIKIIVTSPDENEQLAPMTPCETRLLMPRLETEVSRVCDKPNSSAAHAAAAVERTTFSSPPPSQRRSMGVSRVGTSTPPPALLARPSTPTPSPAVGASFQTSTPPPALVPKRSAQPLNAVADTSGETKPVEQTSAKVGARSRRR